MLDGAWSRGVGEGRATKSRSGSISFNLLMFAGIGIVCQEEAGIPERLFVFPYVALCLSKG